MGIWVKTQKGDLILTKNIIISTQNSIEKPFLIINSVLCQADYHDYDELGEYSTRERCQEIIAEIEDKIYKLHKDTLDAMAGRHVRAATESPIYVMPGE